MAYLSLYRKWRPQTFADVIGQEHIVQTLKNGLNSGRISHAYLFTGPRGTGKTTVARLLAKGLNCENGPTADVCGECQECLSIAQGNSLNVMEIDGASNRGIEEIRDLREQVKYAPTAGRYRVYIIDEVHMLTTEAFNALLKTLEEPPNHVVFILATTDPQKIPATIISRCQRYDFKRFSQEEIVNRLRQVASSEGVQGEKGALELIAEHAQGGMRDALGILDQCLAFSDRLDVSTVSDILGIAGHTRLTDFARAIKEKNSIKAIEIIHQLYSEGKDLAQFSRDLLQFFRKLLLNPETENKAFFYDWEKPEILHVIEVFSGCERDLRYAGDPRIPLELTVLQLTELKTEWEQLKGKIGELEKRVAELATSGVPRIEASQDTIRQPEQKEKIVMSNDDKANLLYIRENWNSFLEALHEERLIQPEAFLREGAPVGLENNILVIAFPKSRGFHKASIEQDKHREPVERILTRFFGLQLRIRCITGDPNQILEFRGPDNASALPNNESLVEEISAQSEEEKAEQGGNKSAETVTNTPMGEEGDPTSDETVAAALRIFGGKVVEIKDDQEG